MTKIKICGLTRYEDIEAANRYKPDYIGFVFAQKSRRFLPPKQAAQFKNQLSADIAAVGVFVNEEKEIIADLLKQDIIDLAQLHGQESEEEICWIKEQTGKPVIKAVSVRTRADVDCWQQSCADYLLLDQGAGGSGCTFDWSLTDGCVKPYFLAGGICSANLTEALKKGAYALDVSSGAETDGKKDPEKMEEMIREVRLLG